MYHRPLPVPSLIVYPASPTFYVGFHRRHIKPATDALGPINVTTTRGAVICGLQNRNFQNRWIIQWLPAESKKRFCKLPRRLATVLPTTYSYTCLQCRKEPANADPLRIPFSHFRALSDFSLFLFPGFFFSRKSLWKGFVPAAPRRAWLHVSEAISGLSLSRPVEIIALLGI